MMKLLDIKKLVAQGSSQNLVLIYEKTYLLVLNATTFTSAVRAFDRGCFCYSASVLEPRHIGVRPKGMTFGLGC